MWSGVFCFARSLNVIYTCGLMYILKRRKEYNYIGEMIGKVKSTIPRDEVIKLLSIYNRVFNDNKQATSCDSCFVNGVWNKLKTVYKEYN